MIVPSSSCQRQFLITGGSDSPRGCHQMAGASAGLLCLGRSPSLCALQDGALWGGLAPFHRSRNPCRRFGIDRLTRLGHLVLEPAEALALSQHRQDIEDRRWGGAGGQGGGRGRGGG